MLLWSSTVPAQNDLLKDIRHNVGEIFKHDSVSKQFEKRFERVVIEDSQVLRGYHGAVLMAKGRHAFSPLNKLKYFNRGKDMLEAAIAEDLNNLELRFLRLTIQVNVPAILGYSSDIDKDVQYVEEQLIELEISGQRKRMQAFLDKAREQGKL